MTSGPKIMHNSNEKFNSHFLQRSFVRNMLYLCYNHEINMLTMKDVLVFFYCS